MYGGWSRTEQGALNAGTSRLQAGRNAIPSMRPAEPTITGTLFASTPCHAASCLSLYFIISPLVALAVGTFIARMDRRGLLPSKRREAATPLVVSENPCISVGKPLHHVVARPHQRMNTL